MSARLGSYEGVPAPGPSRRPSGPRRVTLFAVATAAHVPHIQSSAELRNASPPATHTAACQVWPQQPWQHAWRPSGLWNCRWDTFTIPHPMACPRDRRVHPAHTTCPLARASPLRNWTPAGQCPVRTLLCSTHGPPLDAVPPTGPVPTPFAPCFLAPTAPPSHSTLSPAHGPRAPAPSHAFAPATHASPPFRE